MHAAFTSSTSSWRPSSPGTSLQLSSSPSSSWSLL